MKSLGSLFRRRSAISDSGGRRRVQVVLFALMVCAGTAGAWDVEHDVVAYLTGMFLPVEVKRTMTFDDAVRLIRYCHYPDMTEWEPRRFYTAEEIGAIVGPADQAILTDQGFRNTYWFHEERGRAVAFTLMAKAFNEGQSAKAAFYLSILTHSISDQGALNHPPLMNFAHYAHLKDVDFKMQKVEHGAKNIFGFRSDGGVVRYVREQLKKYTPRIPSTDFQDVTAYFVADGIRLSDASAREEVTIAFSPRPEAEAALVRLVTMQIQTLEDMVWSAWTLRSKWVSPGAVYERALADRKKKVLDALDPMKQAVFAGVFDTALNPPSPKGVIGVVCEPYAFNVTRLSSAGRFVVSAAARTLRSRGYAIKAVSLHDLGGKGVPDGLNALLVSLGAGRLTDHETTAIKTYTAAGGKLIALGGADPRNVTGMTGILVRRADDEIPTSSKWGLQNESVFCRMRVSFSPELSGLEGKKFPILRNPNFGGSNKPTCVYSLKEAMGLRKLAFLENGKETFCIAGRLGNTVWLPEYLLMPYLFTAGDEIRLEDLRLDPFGEKVLLSVLATQTTGSAD